MLILTRQDLELTARKFSYQRGSSGNKHQTGSTTEQEQAGKHKDNTKVSKNRSEHEHAQNKNWNCGITRTIDRHSGSSESRYQTSSMTIQEQTKNTKERKGPN